MKMLMLLAAALAAAPAIAANTFTLDNSMGGDGFVVASSDTRFDLHGNNNDLFDNIVSYGTVATIMQTVSGQFRYLNTDIDGLNFDPAGYFINQDYFQLSDPDLLRYGSNFGTFSFNVDAGDSYGFYVLSTDGAGGRGVLTVGAIPEPASWAMLIAGFGLIGAALRRRRSTSAA